MNIKLSYNIIDLIRWIIKLINFYKISLIDKFKYKLA